MNTPRACHLRIWPLRIKCVVIKAFAADFEQLQRLTSVVGLVLFSRYFDGTCDHKAAAAPFKRKAAAAPDKRPYHNGLLLSGGRRYLRRRKKSNKPIGNMRATYSKH